MKNIPSKIPEKKKLEGSYIVSVILARLNQIKRPNIIVWEI